MTLPHERTRSVARTEFFFMELLRRPRVPQWVREEARRCLRHFPGKSDMLRLEALDLERQGVSKEEIQTYIAAQYTAEKGGVLDLNPQDNS